jgi:hypothetical protein
LFFGERHILMLASAIRLGLERIDAAVVIGHVRAVSPCSATAIAGCVIPLSRNSTIWMRWRCAAGIFHRSTVFSRHTTALAAFSRLFPSNQMA